jgi:outer membrane protein OmpA-like peptidoglycan-associated protein
MIIYRRLLAVSMLSVVFGPSLATADVLTDTLNSLGLQGIFSEVGSTVGTVGASVLDPAGTGDNDFLGADVLNPENDLGVTLMNDEMTGFENKTGSDTAMPLDPLGLSQLLNVLGLTYEQGLATQIRALVGPDGALIVPVEGLLGGLTTPMIDGSVRMAEMAALPGLNNQPIGLALMGEPNSGNATSEGVAGIALMNPGASGNGGMIGVAALSGSDSGNGEFAGISVLSGDNSGDAGTAGIAVLSGNNSGNGDFLGGSVLGGDSSGNGDMAGLAVLSGDSSGTGEMLAAAVLSGAESGLGDVIGVGALNGPGSGGGGLVSIPILNAPTDSANNGGGIDNDGSCATVGAAGCGGHVQLAMLDSCRDTDLDGVCDERDECLDTPADMPVFLTGCHLTEDAALVLRGVNFEFDKSDLTPESLPILEHAVKVLQSQPEALVAVDGHTDWMGSDVYNYRLSYARSRTVYQYLLDAGIDADRLVFRGFGESVAVAPNENEDGSDNPAGRAENRRVELNILDAETFKASKQENISNY